MVVEITLLLIKTAEAGLHVPTPYFPTFIGSMDFSHFSKEFPLKIKSHMEIPRPQKEKF